MNFFVVLLHVRSFRFKKKAKVNSHPPCTMQSCRKFLTNYGSFFLQFQGYFRVLAMEYLSRGIEVSIVCPSLTFSPNNVLNAFSNDINKVGSSTLLPPVSFPQLSF